MNPPFGHQNTKRMWLAKFFSHHCGIALVPDRTSAPWFQEYGPLADAILWVSPKIKFVRPDGTIGGSPGTGTALLAAGNRAVVALLRSKLGFVTQSKPREQVHTSTMNLLYCPQCGAVYVEGVGTGCVNATCQGSHEWCPKPLQPVEHESSQSQPENLCNECGHSVQSHSYRGGCLLCDCAIYYT